MNVDDPKNCFPEPIAGSAELRPGYALLPEPQSLALALALEPWTAAHAAPLLALLLEERHELALREPWRPADFLTLAGQQRRAAAVEVAIAAGDALHYVVVASGQLVGTVGLDLVGPDLAPGDVQLSYWVASRQRRRGHASAAIRLALAQATRRGYRQVCANVVPGNAASQAVLRLLGFPDPGPPVPFGGGSGGDVCLRFRRALPLELPELASAPVAAEPAERVAERERLVDAARGFAEASLAESTRRAYRSDFEDFALWCHNRLVASLPATPETVCLYLADLAQRGRAVSTLQRRLAAIKLAHRTGGHEQPGWPESPTEDVAVRQVMRGIRRTVGIAPRRQAAPLLIQQLRVLLAANPDQSLQDVQDYALLLLGFAFAGRASDLVSIDVADLEFTDRGVLVHLRGSKTDQEKAGEVIAVPTGRHQETDPILAVRRWLERADLTTGPVWRGVDRWGNLSADRLSTRGVTRAIRRAVARTEMDGEGLSSHSLRAGFATSAAAAGASERSIAAQTRHRSMATLRRYIRLATAFDENAVSKVGL